MSKRLKILFGLIFVIAGFFVTRLGLFLFQAVQADAPLSFFSKNQPALITTFIDTDKDGIPDKEEYLFGTDPNNPDTDGDGYIDGEEIITGHDPLKNEVEERNKVKKSNLTTAFAEKIISGIAAGDLDPKKTTQTRFQSGIDIITTTTYNDIDTYFQSTLPEIKLSTDSSKEALNKYLVDIASVLDQPFTDYFPDELSSIVDAAYYLNINDTKTASSLFLNAGYKFANARNTIQSVAVPKQFLDFHNNLTSVFNDTAQSFFILSRVSEDPVLAYGSLNNLTLYQTRAQIIVNDLRSIIEREDLTVPDSILFNTLDLLRIKNEN